MTQSNILVDKDGHVRVADFGLTGFQNATLASKTTNRNGSIQWMAPELLDPERYGLDRFKRTTNSDVYAFACVCSEVCICDKYHDINRFLYTT